MDCGLNSVGFLLEFYVSHGTVVQSNFCGTSLDFYGLPIGIWSDFHEISTEFFLSPAHWSDINGFLLD